VTTEIQFDEAAPADVLPPPIEVEGKPEAKPTAKKDKPKETAKADDGEEERRGGSRLSPEIRELRRNEDRTVKELIESFGDHTAYKIRLTRKEPESVRDASGKLVTTAGFLEWIEGKPIDESWIKMKYGGGKYEVYFRKRSERGGWEYGGQATIVVAGDPNLSDLPRAVQQTDGAAAIGRDSESPTMAKHAMDLMAKQLEREQERNDNPKDATGGVLVEMLREQLRDASRALTEMRTEMRETVNRPPPQSTEDRAKDKLLDKLMDGDTARLTAVRMQYESEIRQIKESMIELERRLRDQFDRDKQEMRSAHEREIGFVKSSCQSDVNASKMAFESALTAAKASFDTQKEILSAENRRLDRDNTSLRDDVKELRAKKEKTIVETLKDVKVIKEALGEDDDDSDKGTAEKIIEGIASPEGLAALKNIFGKEAPVAAAVQQPVASGKPKRRIIKDEEGNRYWLEPDGTRTGPLKAKAREGQPGTEQPQLPQIDPAVVTQVVGYLEGAFTNGTDPEIFARSAKPNVSDQMLMAIRDVGGVDAFLSKVAKLPASSPLLSSQLGRNWVRKVGKVLVGDE
jgi:hypothetical protein